MTGFCGFFYSSDLCFFCDNIIAMNSYWWIDLNVLLWLLNYYVNLIYDASNVYYYWYI